MSAKAQARLFRRLASMAARGHTPAPKEFRCASAVKQYPSKLQLPLPWHDSCCETTGCLLPAIMQRVTSQQVQ
jgi:hypothetical protein